MILCSDVGSSGECVMFKKKLTDRRLIVPIVWAVLFCFGTVLTSCSDPSDNLANGLEEAINSPNNDQLVDLLSLSNSSEVQGLNAEISSFKNKINERSGKIKLEGYGLLTSFLGEPDREVFGKMVSGLSGDIYYRAITGQNDVSGEIIFHVCLVENNKICSINVLVDAQ